MLIAALFTIARAWKQFRCPSTDEYIRKLWYVYPMECYSATKRNGFESASMRWRNLEPIIQSEVSHKNKDKYSILMHTYRIQKDSTDDPTRRAAKGYRHKQQTFGYSGGKKG